MNTPSVPVLAAVVLGVTAHLLFAADPPEPKFREVTIDPKIQIGYGVAVADVDGDKLPDILLADKKQFVWYRNPGAEKSGDPAAWQKHLLAENLTKQDNVCLAAQDIDGDGRCEIAVGAEWNPGDTINSGAVFYLIPPADRTQPWTPVKLHAEPTTHRMRWIKLEAARLPTPAPSPLDADGPPRQSFDKWGLVVVPLHGRGNKNGEGAGVKVLLYHPPAQLNDPNGEWKTELIDESMHMTHNFAVTRPGPNRPQTPTLLLSGKEGLVIASYEGQRWLHAPLPEFKEAMGENFKGIGEVRDLHAGLRSFAATVEPMHGTSLVIYRDDSGERDRMVWTRHVLTDKLSDGHGLACGDLLGLGSDQIVVGWRGKPGAPDSTTGVAVWTPLDPQGEKWRETNIDPTGMACEDLQLADLNGDGKLDIVASGRATKNVKIYFNETAR